MASSAVILFLVTMLSYSHLKITHAANLPSFLTACSRSDPTSVLSACALKVGRKGLPELLKGDASVNVPSLLPLTVSEIILSVGPNLEFQFTNGEFHGLDTTILNKITIDLEKNQLMFDVDIPTLSLISQYKVNGQIMILPIVGEGPCNLTLSGGNYLFTTDLVYFTKKNSVKYVRLENSALDFTVKLMTFKLENLFNGDLRLGGELNKFFSENWKEVSDELKPALIEVIRNIIANIANGFLGKIPLEKLFTK